MFLMRRILIILLLKKCMRVPISTAAQAGVEPMIFYLHNEHGLIISGHVFYIIIRLEFPLL